MVRDVKMAGISGGFEFKVIFESFQLSFCGPCLKVGELRLDYDQAKNPITYLIKVPSHLFQIVKS